MTENVRDAGYDDLLDAIEAGEGFYLRCANGHGSLPPRRACPHCGTQALEQEPLPESGEIETYTVVHVATPEFAEDTPYVTAVVNFGPVRLTGQVRGIDPEEVSTGLVVGAGVEQTATMGERLLTFRPR
ncbi:Zn-ribbon domain-containing OB-fold protein [Haladaptatus sp. YSMS36]|uniref:Zn-ribbon domain-containing OB-fold protein n=1 Tax=Haladaptatus sp. YSMS36 TaxID=3033384 RepID=UPI0023E803AF|nr:OB-fold domain-containing protein [Haladaptatus sp. YSMS36]